MSAIESTRFHLRHAWFNVREQFSDLLGGVAANASIPFFVWLLSHLWQRFNGYQKNFTFGEIVIYIGITEMLFMTFVRGSSISRASDDFSIALARPRSWLVSSFSGLVGRSLGGRMVMLVVLLASLVPLGADPMTLTRALMRLFFLLPWLALLQGLFALFFSVAQVLWHQTSYFLLPFGKVFLVLGGVWGPVADFSEPWRSVLLQLPPSDLFFQPAYFCLKGEFYRTSITHWLLRTGLLAVALAVGNQAFFRHARRRHQAYGG